MTATSGPCSREELTSALADLLGQSERLKCERLRVFRLHLQASVRDVSPIVLDLAALLDTSIDRIAARFRPPSHWSTTFSAGVAEGLDGMVGLGQTPPGADAPVRLAGRPGTLADGVSCTFTLLGGRIEALAIVDGVPVQTCGDRVSLLLLEAAECRPVVGGIADRLAPDRLMRDRSYPIEAVTAGFTADRMLVTLRTKSRTTQLDFREAQLGWEGVA